MESQGNTNTSAAQSAAAVAHTPVAQAPVTQTAAAQATDKPVLEAMTFADFALAEPLQRGLVASEFTHPTAIQAQALPIALQGRDLMASAQTGTGKTAAFALPALQRLLTPSTLPGRGPRVLVLTPTRELASQVESVIRELGRFTRLKMGLVVGGVSYQPQERLLRGSVDILVATPGRLIDHLDNKLVDFSRLELLVLDEADRMLDMGFIVPVRKIAAALPIKRQTMLFSATLEGAVLSVAKQLMRDPVAIQLASAKKRHEGITQRVHPAAGPDHKHALLTHLLADPTVTQALIFTTTKRGASKLAKRLTDAGHPSEALHGNMRQSARNKTVDLLRKGKIRLLVATDVAARGIDVDTISHVINYELPTVAEDYIHRIGRTGRNGATGTAISLIGPDDRTRLSNIERLIGRRLEQQIVAVSVPPRAAGSPASDVRPGSSGRRHGAHPGRSADNFAAASNRRGPGGNSSSRGNGKSGRSGGRSAPSPDNQPFQSTRRGPVARTGGQGWR